MASLGMVCGGIRPWIGGSGKTLEDGSTGKSDEAGAQAGEGDCQGEALVVHAVEGGCIEGDGGCKSPDRGCMATEPGCMAVVESLQRMSVRCG